MIIEQAFNDLHFADIIFSEAKHTYKHAPSQHQLISCSKFYNQFVPPFDAERIAADFARRTGRTVDEILTQWEHKRKQALAFGTTLHRTIQDSLEPGNTNGQHDPHFIWDTRPPEYHQWYHWYTKSRQQFTPIATELVIGCPIAGIGGTIDALMWRPSTNTIHIFDWKTGKFRDTNHYENLLSPFDSYPAGELQKYSLQQTVYKIILSRTTNYKIGTSYLVHITRSGVTQWEVIDDFEEPLTKIIYG